MLGTEPKALCRLGKCATSELKDQPLRWVFCFVLFCFLCVCFCFIETRSYIGQADLEFTLWLRVTLNS